MIYCICSLRPIITSNIDISLSNPIPFKPYPCWRQLCSLNWFKKRLIGDYYIMFVVFSACWKPCALQKSLNGFKKKLHAIEYGLLTCCIHRKQSHRMILLEVCSCLGSSSMLFAMFALQRTPTVQNASCDLKSCCDRMHACVCVCVCGNVIDLFILWQGFKAWDLPQ